MIAEADIERALDYLRSSANEAAQARANMKYLAEFLDVKLAQIIKAMPSDTSATAAKNVAKADPGYLTTLDGYKVAIEQDARHQFKREAADALIRAWQTQQSNLRAEGRAYG
jgi:predicted transcriptional regulator of viral defense system